MTQAKVELSKRELSNRLIDGDVDLTESQQRGFKLEVFSLIASQKPITTFVSILSALFFAFILQQYIASTWVMVWLLAFACNFFLRYRILSQTVETDQIDQQLINVTRLSIVNGFLHAIIMLAFPYFSLQEQMVITIIMVGLCAGTVSSTAGYTVIFIGYCLPISLGLIIGWGLLAEANIFSYVLSFLSMCFGFMLYSASKNFCKTFRYSYSIRLQNDQLVEQLQQAWNDAVESEAAKTRFLAATGHDLSQPIQSINLTLATLSMQRLSKKSADLIDNLQRSIETLNHQLNELLVLARMDAGATKPTYINISLDTLKKQLVSEFTPLTKKHGLEFEIHFPTDVYLLSDPILLLRIFRNLLSNAIKYTDEGLIKIAASIENEYCIFEIRDTGIGISDADINVIFEEFTQLNNPERDSSKGIGLGLSIVKRLISLLNIELNVSSIQGEGTVFKFHVPLGEDSDEYFIEPRTDLLKGYCFLIIDDDRNVLTAMEALLSEIGCDIVSAQDGESALEQLTKYTPDMVLCDYRLKGNYNGIELIQLIRKQTPSMKALLISGETNKQCLLDAEKAGISFLSKPVAIDDLITTMNLVVN